MFFFLFRSLQPGIIRWRGERWSGPNGLAIDGGSTDRRDATGTDPSWGPDIFRPEIFSWDFWFKAGSDTHNSWGFFLGVFSFESSVIDTTVLRDFWGEFFWSKRSWTPFSQSWICLYVGWRCTSPSKSSKVLLSPKASHFWGKISPKMSATSLNQTSSHSVRSLFFVESPDGNEVPGEPLHLYLRWEELWSTGKLNPQSSPLCPIFFAQAFCQRCLCHWDPDTAWCENVKQKISSIGMS